MSLFEKNEWQMGISILDRQHQNLIDILSELDHIRTGPNRLTSNYGQILQRFELHTRIHFLIEEELMRICITDDFENHKILHTSFLKRICNLRISYQEGGAFMIDKVSQYLNRRLFHHIQSHDKALGSYLKSCGLK